MQLKFLEFYGIEGGLEVGRVEDKPLHFYGGREEDV